MTTLQRHRPHSSSKRRSHWRTLFTSTRASWFLPWSQSSCSVTSSSSSRSGKYLSSKKTCVSWRTAKQSLRLRKHTSLHLDVGWAQALKTAIAITRFLIDHNSKGSSTAIESRISMWWRLIRTSTSQSRSRNSTKLPPSSTKSSTWTCRRTFAVTHCSRCVLWRKIRWS